jgi:hypothetical protein
MGSPNWSNLIFGSYGRQEIDDAVSDPDWQDVRMDMKGTSLESRYVVLNLYLDRERNSRKAKIRVTNYVNALKRGGMIK